MLRQFEVVAVILDGLNSGMQSDVESRVKLNYTRTHEYGPVHLSIARNLLLREQYKLLSPPAPVSGL